MSDEVGERPGVSARTQVVAVIGDPISHSLSPVIHNAAFRSAGLDWVCVALPVGAGDAVAAARAMRSLGIRGMSVTMPHKSDILVALDELSDVAARLGSVNCVTLRDGRLVGDNTDGDGFLGGLRDDFGLDPDGAHCVVLGAGGAARAVVLALARAGAASVRVVNRTAARAERAAALAGAVGSVGGAHDVASADLVVNATPVGMADTSSDGRAAVPVDVGLLREGQIVAELVYHPAVTPLMRAADAVGARTANGVSMLVHQAGVAFTNWTGVAAPLDAMVVAARRALDPSLR
jgi:shikimate dehydrogenase